MMVTLSLEVSLEDGHNLKLVLIQSIPVLLEATLSKADHEFLIEVEQEPFTAAAEKSLVTILPKASQGVVVN